MDQYLQPLQGPQPKFLEMQHAKKKAKLVFKFYLEPAMASRPVEVQCLESGFVTTQTPYIHTSYPFWDLQPRTSMVLPVQAPRTGSNSTTITLQPPPALVPPPQLHGGTRTQRHLTWLKRPTSSFSEKSESKQLAHRKDNTQRKFQTNTNQILGSILWIIRSSS